MRRWLPNPAMSAFVLLTWLLLNQSLAPGHLLLGALFGLSVGFILRRLQTPPLRIRNPRLLLRLAGRVGWDIVHANFALLLTVLSGRTGRVRSGFVSVPLQLSDPFGLAVLACIITATPGTIWMSYQSAERVLLIHVFHLVDEAVWIHTITDRYERPLREIFE
jgi:Multisubunit Na+/H+ antiporter, MnhE subunit